MDRNALIKALRDTAQSASNTIASGLSGPVDLIAAGLRMGGLPIDNPVGGSQWLEQRGLTRPVEQGVPQVIGETLGMVGPVLATRYAPQIANVINRGAQNLAAGGAPAMRGQMGGVYMGGPRQEALETAQRNAAKPVSEGGLGLPPNNTPMDRARAMGFDVSAYHGTATPVDFASFRGNPSKHGQTFVALDAAEANVHAPDSIGSRVMPLLVKLGKTAPGTATWGNEDAYAELAKRYGRESFRVRDDWRSPVNLSILNPANIRSRFAAFDPARINENDLLGRADPRLLGLMGLGAAGGLGAYNYMQGQ